MDPSYTNSVQNGGVSGGEALGGRPIISSGDGLGMNTANVAVAAPAPRRRWPWVVIGVLVAVVVGVVAVVMNQRNSGNDSEKAGSVKEEFNRYVNYIISGENSTASVDENNLPKMPIYAYSLMEGDGGLDEYLKALNHRYEAFASVYEGDDDVSNINNYFYEYVKNGALSSQELLNMYIELGKTGAQNALIVRYGVGDNVANRSWMDYLEAELNHGLTVVAYYAGIDSAGCIYGSQINTECVLLVPGIDELMAELDNVISEEFDARLGMQAISTATLARVYNEIYGLEGAYANE